VGKKYLKKRIVAKTRREVRKERRLYHHRKRENWYPNSTRS